MEIVDAPDHMAAANRAVVLVAAGQAYALLKGHLHTNDLLHAALRKEDGLRTGRRFTDVFVMDVRCRSEWREAWDHPHLVARQHFNEQDSLRSVNAVLTISIPNLSLPSVVCFEVEGETADAASSRQRNIHQ